MVLGVTAALALGLSNLWSHSLTVGLMVLYWLASLNLTTFGAYGADKIQAKRGSWRVPEKTLLWLAFLGGSPGAWAAMTLFRHKTIKTRFRFAFWAVVAAQFGFVAVLIWIECLPDAH
jgi:uncharacterized membrane protein YsdA (DUF1294 family)